MLLVEIELNNSCAAAALVCFQGAVAVFCACFSLFSPHSTANQSRTPTLNLVAFIK